MTEGAPSAIRRRVSAVNQLGAAKGLVLDLIAAAWTEPTLQTPATTHTLHVSGLLGAE